MYYNSEAVITAIKKSTLNHNVSKRYLIMKRATDIVLSLIGIVSLSFLFILVAVAIKLDFPGPVLFVQERCGYNGKIFKMYKFRSMISNASLLIDDIKLKNEVQGHMFKIKNDPRITRVGKFLRKTSIDELPQLFNVLKGDMSIVGPRPPILTEVSQYSNWHNLRLSAKPGITGLWQVSKRNTVGFEEMIRLDLKYLRERSFTYDMKIILKTIPLLFGDKRAY